MDAVAGPLDEAVLRQACPASTGQLPQGLASWPTLTSAGFRTSCAAPSRRTRSTFGRQPSSHGFKVIPLGAPFFFRLGALNKAIAGCGFFVRYERVPVWFAWQSFGDLSGTDTFAEMTARLKAIRRRTGSALLAHPRD